MGQDSDQLAVLSERLEAMEQDNARLRAALASRKRGASEDEVRYQGTRVAWCTLFLPRQLLAPLAPPLTVTLPLESVGSPEQVMEGLLCCSGIEA